MPKQSNKTKAHLREIMRRYFKIKTDLTPVRAGWRKGEVIKYTEFKKEIDTNLDYFEEIKQWNYVKAINGANMKKYVTMKM